MSVKIISLDGKAYKVPATNIVGLETSGNIEQVVQGDKLILVGKGNSQEYVGAGIININGNTISANMDNYYTVDEINDLFDATSGYLDRTKQDTLIFGYDSTDAISSINGNPLVGNNEKDWTDEINSASSYAYSQAVEDLEEVSANILTEVVTNDTFEETTNYLSGVIEQISTDYYPNTNPSGFISNAALINYYEKTETSGAEELSAAFKMNTDAIDEIKETGINWDNTYETVSTNSAIWNETNTILYNNSSNWNNSYNALTSTSGIWNEHSALSAAKLDKIEFMNLSSSLATQTWVEEQLGDFGGYIPCEANQEGYPIVEGTPNKKAMYLTPKENAPDPDHYYNWIVTGDEPNTGWLCIGDTSLSLENYVTTTELETVSEEIEDKIPDIYIVTPTTPQKDIANNSGKGLFYKDDDGQLYPVTKVDDTNPNNVSFEFKGLDDDSSINQINFNITDPLSNDPIVPTSVSSNYLIIGTDYYKSVPLTVTRTQLYGYNGGTGRGLFNTTVLSGNGIEIDLKSEYYKPNSPSYSAARPIIVNGVEVPWEKRGAEYHITLTIEGKTTINHNEPLNNASVPYGNITFSSTEYGLLFGLAAFNLNNYNGITFTSTDNVDISACCLNSTTTTSFNDYYCYDAWHGGPFTINEPIYLPTTVNNIKMDRGYLYSWMIEDSQEYSITYNLQPVTSYDTGYVLTAENDSITGLNLNGRIYKFSNNNFTYRDI